MAALHPETVELLRKNLADLNTQHHRDLEKLAKLQVESRSLMAQKLRARIAATVPVMRDLEQILPPVHDAGTAPSVELDRRARWVADGRALLDFIEANPELPLNLYHSVEISYHPLPTSGNDADRMAAVDAVAEQLGVPVVGPDDGHHYEAEIRFGAASYTAVAVLQDYSDEHAEIQRLGRAALEQQKAGAEGGAS